VVTYTIVVANAGPNAVLGASVIDTFPVELNGVAYTSTTTGGATGNTEAGTGHILDTVDMPAGSTITYIVMATVDSAASGTLSNGAVVFPPPKVTDPDLANNVSGDCDALTPVADLQIHKDDGQTIVALGETITYTITVTNAGPNRANGATITDSFPSGLNSVQYTSSATGGATGNTSLGTGNISDTVDMPPGSTITYVVDATVDPDASGSITNTAIVMPPVGTGDPNPENNFFFDINTIQIPGPPAVIMNDDDPPVDYDGDWVISQYCPEFYEDDVSWAAAGSGESTVAFVFTGLTAGDYRVSTTWLTVPEYVHYRATNAPFTISGGAADFTILVDQTLNPGDYTSAFTDAGSTWMDLHASYTITGDTLTVTVSNNADNYVVADAIRIERIAGMP
jgi:uncharacterized repeat protein (TIGR01451 family)